MAVSSYFPWQAEQFVDQAGRRETLRLLRNNRVLSVVAGSDLEARVFDSDGLAFTPHFSFVGGEFLPACSCKSGPPCVHSAALLVYGFHHGLLPGFHEYELDDLVNELIGLASGSDLRAGNDAQDLFFTGSPTKEQKHDRPYPLHPSSENDAPSGIAARHTGRTKPSRRGDSNFAVQSPAVVVSTDDSDGDQVSKDMSSDPFSEAFGERDEPQQSFIGRVEPFLKIQATGQGTGIEFWFRYPHGEVGWREPENPSIDHTAADEIPLKRQHEAENAFVSRVRSLIGADLVFERGLYADLFKDGPLQDLQIRNSPEEFLMDKGARLLAEGIEVRIENRPVRIDKELVFTVESDLDLLGIRASVKSVDGSTVLPITRMDSGALSRGMVEADGQFVLLRSEDLKRLEYLSRRGMSGDGLLTASSINMVLLEKIYQQTSAEDRAAVNQILERKACLDDIRSIPVYDPPVGLATRLRNYQHYGYNWLNYMLDNSLNPCLADDMGLGKTIQTLSLLLNRREKSPGGTSLVVCPVVTMANWEAEARRFTPDLEVVLHKGDNRAQSVDELVSADVVLVSYQTLRMDLAIFVERRWDLLILDEAHYIKNIQSQIFKTVRSISANHRVSLTGTPIENSVMELFAQMDFLNPGLLGTPRQFYADFFKGIQREGDENLLDELKELVRPFILRRTKDEVLEELPGKEVMVRYVDMEADQRELYEFQRNQILEELEITSEASLKGTLVFKSLLQLRQLAIHPPLADRAHHGVSSAKIDSLELLMSDILQEDHKVLIFSQFIGSLEAISGMCEKRGWDRVLLTGKTQDRSREVERFQKDPDVKVFLLSLKAGGVGINLTAADYVIIFDPWWNPAAEQQAIDRAHRMGQTKRVMAYKLIVRDSIEEKILELQNQKSMLADEIINAGGSLLSHLSREQMLSLFS